MKILIITPWYPNAIDPSLGSFIRDQAKALFKEGYHVSVMHVDANYRKIFKKIGTHHFNSSFKIENGINVFRYKGIFPPKFFFNLYTIWNSFFKILFKKYVQQYGLPDIIHAHTFHVVPIASFIFKKYGIPFVLTEHSSILITHGVNTLRKQLIQSGLENASKVITVSNGLKQVIQPYLKNEILVIPNLIDIDLFAPKTFKKDQHFIKVLAVGDLVPIKGFHLLLEAVAQLKPQLKEKLHLSIIGKGPEHDRLQKLINTLQLNHQVHLGGELPRKVIAEKMQTSNFYILSSLQETFGIVLIEAMATGLPVLATKCAGSSDLINKKVGYIIEAGSAHALTQGIEKMMAEYQNFSSTEIRKYVVESFGEKIIVKKLTYLYQSAIQKKLVDQKEN